MVATPNPRKTPSDLIVNLKHTERLLRCTNLIAIGQVRCPAWHPDFAFGGPSMCPYVGFSRLPVALMRQGRPEISTFNTVRLHDVGQTYGRKAINKMGDNADWIAISPSLAQELLWIARYSSPGGDNLDFPCTFAPLSSAHFLAQRRLFNATKYLEAIDDLSVEDCVIPLLTGILEAAFSFSDRRGKIAKASRPSLNPRQIASVQEIKRRLATECGTQYSLPELARCIHSSPGWLSRIFPRYTGYSVHQYQLQLRLRLSLQLLQQPVANVANVASDLGFSSHSHFSAMFRHHFRVSPSAFASGRHPLSVVRPLADTMDRRHSRHWPIEFKRVLRERS